MKTKQIFLMLIFLILMITACSNNRDEFASTINDTTTEDELSFQGVLVGNIADRAIEKIGRPQSIIVDVELSNGDFGERFNYGETELVVIYGTVGIIRTSDPEIKTSRGIGVGDPTYKIIELYKDKEMYLNDQGYYIRTGQKILIFVLNHDKSIIESIEYAGYDSFNNASSTTYEEMTDMSEKVENDYKFDSRSERPRIIEVDNISFDLETGQVHGLGISAAYHRNEIIKVLKKNSEFSEQNGTILFDSGLVILNENNQTEQITVNYEGSMTVSDFIEKYGSPTEYEDAGSSHLYSYKFYSRGYWFYVLTYEPDGLIKELIIRPAEN